MPDPDHFSLDLPYPPTLNTYWRHPRTGAAAGRHLISKRGRAYRREVGLALMTQRPTLIQMGFQFPLTCPLALRVTATAPDRRVRDLDNLCKALFDALKHAGLYDDDSRIRDYHMRWQRCGSVTPGGRVRVDIWL